MCFLCDQSGEQKLPSYWFHVQQTIQSKCHFNVETQQALVLIPRVFTDNVYQWSYSWEGCTAHIWWCVLPNLQCSKSTSRKFTLFVKTLNSVILQFLLFLASCACFLLQFVWHVSNVPLSTQQNSLRLCCSCFHRNVISSLQPGQSVSLAMVARQYLCPFSLLHCSCGELRPERKNVWEVWSKDQVWHSEKIKA